MSRRNSRDGMDRISQGYQGSGSVDPQSGYPVPFRHFPWNMQAHQSVPGSMRPPVIPGQHGGSGSSGGEDIANFYKNLPALQDGLGEHSRNSYTGRSTSLSRPQQPQMNYPSHSMPVRFPAPLIADRLETPNKEKAMNPRQYFPVPQACQPARVKHSQEMPRNLHMPTSMASSMVDHIGYPGMSFPQAPSEYSYPTLSQMLEREGNFGRGPPLHCGPVPPWIPQMTPSQRIPHMANLIPPQVRNSSPNLNSESSISRESPVESLPEETNSPGLIGRWYKLPTEEKTALPQNLKKVSDSVEPLTERVKESENDNCQAVASISQNALPASVSADTRLGRLQELVDRLRASKEGFDETSKTSQDNVPRETITISPEVPVVRENSQASTIRISPDIPRTPLRTSEQVPNKLLSSVDLAKRNDSGISILNCFSLNSNNTKETVPIVIDDENNQPPSESIIAGVLEEKRTENSETFLPPNGSGISEIIIPASTLTIEANKISCSEKTSMENDTLSAKHVGDTTINSSEQGAPQDDTNNRNTISVPNKNEQIEKLATKENPQKASDQFRIKLKMSCTSESGIICRFSKIASAGMTSRYLENIVRDSPDANKSPNTTTPPILSVRVESKQHSENTTCSSLPIKTSSLFKNVQKTNREKKTMHVQPLQQVLQNSVTSIVEKTDALSDSPTEKSEEPQLSEKEGSEIVDKCLDVAVSSEDKPSLSLSEIIPLESSANIVVNNIDKSNINIDRTVSLSSNLCVPSEKYMPLETSDSSETDNTSYIPSVKKSAIEVTGSVTSDSGSADNKDLNICGTDSHRSLDVAGSTAKSEDLSIIQTLSAKQDGSSVSCSPIKAIVTPSAKIVKHIKQSQKRKRAKIFGRRFCRSSSKLCKLKKESNIVSNSDDSKQNKSIQLPREQTDDPVDRLPDSCSVETCMPSLHAKKFSNANVHGFKTSTGSRFKDPSVALEVVYRSCMKNIEIPSHRSYYNSKIFKKKICGSKRLNKKCKKKTNIPLTPDPTMPILFVNFHGKRLMCLKMTTGKYLVMREFLKCCFSFKDLDQGMRKYKQIYLAKERDLSIPYVELCTSQRDRVVQYLKDEGHLAMTCRASHVGLIAVSDALRLYHYFKGVKLCGNTCLEDKDQISGEGFTMSSSEDGLHTQEATLKAESAIDASQLLNSEQHCHSRTQLKESTNILSPISDDNVRSSSCDKGIGTCQDNLSDLEQGYLTDDSDATMPYIDGIALKRQYLEDVRSIKSKRFKHKKKSTEKDSVVRGGLAELYGYAFRFIVLDEKKFVPFKDLCFYFEEKGVYDLVQQSCFHVYGCSNSEVIFLNNLDSILPKLQEDKSMVVEEDVLHAIAGNARSILQNFFKNKWQKTRQKNTVELEITAAPESEKLSTEVNPSQPENRTELQNHGSEGNGIVDMVVDDNMLSTADDVVSTVLLMPCQSNVTSLACESAAPSFPPNPPVTTSPQPEQPTVSPSPAPQTDNKPNLMGSMEDEWVASQHVMTKAFLALVKQNIVLKDRLSDLDKEVKTMREQRQSMELLVKKYEEMLAVFGEECG